MPKPVTNAQIEDVLSSIRRLVREETRPEPAGEQSAAPEETVSKAERLVLTPSLRVDDEPEEIASADLQKEIAAAWKDGAWAESEARADVGDAFVAEEQAAQFPELETADLSLAAADEALLAESGFDDGYDGGVDALAGVAGETAEDESASAPAAAEEAAGTEQGQDLFVALRHVAERAGVAPAEADTDAEDEPPFVEPAFQSTRSESLSAKIEALEAAIGRTRDQWEPDGLSGDAYAGTPVETIAWRDHSEDEDMSAPQAGVEGGSETDAEAETGQLMPEEEAVLDEESLRELVAEIVRQELQGALGERITRNVRKLVRREIHRALAAQDLE